MIPKQKKRKKGIFHFCDVLKFEKNSFEALPGVWGPACWHRPPRLGPESRKSLKAAPCPIHRCTHKTRLPSSLRPTTWGMAHTGVLPSSTPKIITSWKLRAGGPKMKMGKSWI